MTGPAGRKPITLSSGDLIVRLVERLGEPAPAGAWADRPRTRKRCGPDDWQSSRHTGRRTPQFGKFWAEYPCGRRPARGDGGQSAGAGAGRRDRRLRGCGRGNSPRARAGFLFDTGRLNVAVTRAKEQADPGGQPPVAGGSTPGGERGRSSRPTCSASSSTNASRPAPEDCRGPDGHDYPRRVAVSRFLTAGPPALRPAPTPGGTTLADHPADLPRAPPQASARSATGFSWGRPTTCYVHGHDGVGGGAERTGRRHANRQEMKAPPAVRPGC